MNWEKVAVLFGGDSGERAVSLDSGQAVLDSLLRSGVNAHPFDPAQRDLCELKQNGFTCAFIVLHGGTGENGVVQANLQMLGIPYTGCGVETSVLGMDKYLSKLLWQAAGLPVPRFALLDEHSDFAGIERDLGLPLFIKPAAEGSSLGVHKITTSGSLKTVFDTLHQQHYHHILAEEAITGGEYTVGIVGEQVLPSIRIVPARTFYDYQAKYERDDTIYQCPSDLNTEQEQQLAILAKRAFDVLGGRGWGRVDFLRDAQGRFYLLEINTVPGMTSHSLVPKASAVIGMDFDALCLEILRHAR